MMPLFFIHTWFGGHEFFEAGTKKDQCRTKYQGEVFYVIIYMFALSMCFVFVLLFFCVLMPVWIKNFRNRRRRRNLAGRLEHMDGLIEDPGSMARPLIDDLEETENRIRNRRIRREEARRRAEAQREQLNDLLQFLNNELEINDDELELLLDRR